MSNRAEVEIRPSATEKVQLNGLSSDGETRRGTSSIEFFVELCMLCGPWR